MRQKLHNRIHALIDNQNGATAVIYALCLLPLVLMMGLAIDFSRMVSAEKHVQAATDQAVLASAIDFAKNANLSEGERLALALDTFNVTFDADIATANRDLSVTGRSISRIGDNGIQGDVTTSLKLAFGGLFGRESVSIPASSAAELSPPQDLEIVLVLDNTTSMFRNNRFNLMRSAAKGFVNDLMDASVGPGATAIGVVPWATLININSERPGGFNLANGANRTPTAAGTRDVPNAPFEDRLRYLLEPEEEEAYTREALENDFAPVAWRGCIRSAPDERIVSGAGGVSRALTDAPVPGMRWHVALLRPELESVIAQTGFDETIDVPVEASFTLEPGRIFRCRQRAERGAGNIYNNADRACSDNNRGNIEFIEACVSDPNEFDYFRQGGEACPWQENIFPWTSARQISGPNQNCPSAMLGLSEDRGQLIDKLDEMYPVSGGTHMDIGLTWGLRMLSPRAEWAGFFGQTRPTAYEEEGARKIMVLLTDGQNIAPTSFEGYYGCLEGDTRGEAGECWQAPGVRNLSGNALNGLTLDACTEIRDTYNIDIFTIAVDITDGQSIDLLAECAGEEARAFNISASEIDAVFESIAAQELRLTQ